MTEDVFPRRNLPPGAEKWGRAVEDALALLLKEVRAAKGTAGNAMSATAGLAGALGSQAAILAEQTPMLEEIVASFAPTARLERPTTPALASVLGTVNVRWNGLLGIAAPAAGFREVYARMSTVAPTARPGTVRIDEWVDPTPWVRVGQPISAAGEIVVQADAGRQLWFDLVAVDFAGNESLPSDSAKITAVGLVAGTQIADGVIVEKHLAAEAVTANAIAVGALDGQIITGATVQTNAEARRGVKIVGRTLKAYDDKGTEVASLGGPTGAVLVGGIRTRDGWYSAELIDSGGEAGGVLQFIGSSMSAPRGSLQFNHSAKQLTVGVIDGATEKPAGVMVATDQFTLLQHGSSKTTTRADGATIVTDPDQIGVKATGPFMIRGNIPAAIQPAGTVQMFASSGAPDGWLLCHGQAVSRTTYSILFSAIGTTWGAGDGATTFNVPDLRGRAPVGFDSGQTEFNAVGKAGGAKTHKLTTDELPSHAHEFDGHTYEWGDGGNVNIANAIAQGGRSGQNRLFTYQNTEGWAFSYKTGGDQPHNNLQPYATMTFIIKT